MGGMLGNQEILFRIKQDCLIEPFQEKNLQPASYDLTLGGEFLVPIAVQNSPNVLSFTDKPAYHVYKGDGFILRPQEFCLATTREKVSLPLDLAGVVDGRSSIGRLGLTVHVTAGFIDPGFQGCITLEIFNVAPYAIELQAGRRVAQICFFQVQGCNQGYRGKYQGQSGVVGSKIYLDERGKDGAEEV
jgi:dCTP deaminase